MSEKTGDFDRKLLRRAPYTTGHRDREGKLEEYYTDVFGTPFSLFSVWLSFIQTYPRKCKS